MTDYKNLWKSLSKDIEANLQFAQLVMQENKANIDYFFGDYSSPIIRGIAISHYAGEDFEDVVPFIISEYYMFVVSPIIDGKKKWYQLATYKGINGKTLRGWLTEHGGQHFSKLIIREKKRNQMSEYVDYNTLIKVIDDSNNNTGYNEECYANLEKAWNALHEKYKKVLTVLVKNKTHWSEAWQELNSYINPKDGREVMVGWDNKKKQDALASLKARALQHLILEFKKVDKNERY